MRQIAEGLRAAWPTRQALVVYVAADTAPLLAVALVAAATQVHRTRPDRLLVFREATPAGQWVPTLVSHVGRLQPYAPGVPDPPWVASADLPGFPGQSGRRYVPLLSGSPLGAGLVAAEAPWDTLHLATAAQVRHLLAATPSVGLVLTGPVRAVLAAAAACPPASAVRVTTTTLGRWPAPVLECDPLCLTG